MFCWCFFDGFGFWGDLGWVVYCGVVLGWVLIVVCLVGCVFIGT